MPSLFKGKIKMGKKCICISLSFLLFYFSLASANWILCYDPNTEVTIQGEIVLFNPYQRGGPQRFWLQVDEKKILVFLAPWWFLEKKKITFKVGDKVKVVGCKFYNNAGQICLIAREIVDLTTKKTYIFRNPNGIPCWRGKCHQRFANEAI